MKSVSIVGASGMLGGELLRLLANCDFEISRVFADSSAGKKASAVHKHLDCQKTLEKWDGDPASDLLFFATPAGFCSSALAKNPDLPTSCKVVDLSADFRLKAQGLYEKFYGFVHPCPQLLAGAEYGLPELHFEKIKAAKLVANPGCHATAAILALAPFAKDFSHASIASCTGVSGAGNSPSSFNSFCNCAEDVFAYDAAFHKHLPEIQGQVGEGVSFTPVLVPIGRGILSVSRVFFNEEASQGGLESKLKKFYEGKPFVKIVEKPQNPSKNWMPSAKLARGTNVCFVAVDAVDDGKTAVVVSSIDNLVKGAAGQAIQNANLLAGFNESAGLPRSPVFP